MKKEILKSKTNVSCNDKIGEMPDGTTVKKYTLSNANGMQVGILDYGGTVKEILHLIAMEISKMYLWVLIILIVIVKKDPYFGCITGRYANRIAKGKFKLDGNDYQLAINNEPNPHLHGGNRGFDKYVWNTRILDTGTGVEFARTSPDGEEGYPGNPRCKVKYTLTDDNELVVEYEARS